MTEFADKPERVRIAQRSDEHAIFDILVAMHRENGSGWGFPYRPEKVMVRIEEATRPDPRTRTVPTDQRRGIIGLVDGPLVPRAIIGLYIEEPLWFSDSLALQETFFYIRPGEREERIYENLFAFGLWAHAMMKKDLEKSYPLDFPYLTGFMNCRDPREVEIMERLWRRHSGAVKCGVLFMRR